MARVWGILRSYVKGDKWLLIAVGFLTVLSVLAVYSSTSALAYQKMHGDTSYYLFRHFGMLLGGLFFMTLASNLKPKYYSGLSILMVGASIMLLICALAFGSSINGSSRWIRLGAVSFQPSEIAKVSLMVYSARVLASNKDNPDKAFWWVVVAAGAVCGLIMLENLSTFILVATSVGLLMVIGRVSLTKLGLLASLLGLFVGLVIYFAPLVSEVFPPAKRAITWRARIERFIGDDKEQETKSRRGDKTQEEQALVAVSTGGLTGRGPGNSYMKNFLPMAYSDFIFSTILEEYGLWGGILVVAVYFVIFARARSIAMNCKKEFHLYTVAGLSIMLTLQAFINMMVGVGLMPVTGQTLPMVSMGGTSNLITGMTFGIILSISEETQLLPGPSVISAKRKKKAEPEESGN